MSDPQTQFAELSNAFLALANQKLTSDNHTQVSMALLAAAARFNAHVVAAARRALTEDPSAIVERLSARMHALAESERFEEAAETRNRLSSLLRGLDRLQRLTPLARSPQVIAAARQALLISSAGVTMKFSSSAYSIACGMIMRRKAMEAVIAAASSSARICGETRETRPVMRICSPRRSATTAPSMESQRKRREASSSDQTSGAWKT